MSISLCRFLCLCVGSRTFLVSIVFFIASFVFFLCVLYFFFVYCCFFFFFFFSSRRRHTRCLSDWSSDVCSSDLQAVGEHERDRAGAAGVLRALDLQVERDRGQRVREVDRVVLQIGRASCRERV